MAMQLTLYLFVLVAGLLCMLPVSSTKSCPVETTQSAPVPEVPFLLFNGTSPIVAPNSATSNTGLNGLANATLTLYSPPPPSLNLVEDVIVLAPNGDFNLFYCRHYHASVLAAVSIGLGPVIKCLVGIYYRHLRRLLRPAFTTR